MPTTVLNNYDTAKAVVQLGIKKANTPYYRTTIQGFMGAMFVALGYMGYHVVTASLIHVDSGLARLLGATVFPVGLMLVVFIGGDLFTGNALVSLAYLDKKIKLHQVMLNWLFVWIGNFLGAIMTAYLISYAGFYTGDVASTALSAAVAKVSMPFNDILVSAFFCNILVSLGVWMANAMNDGAGKIWAIWFPIMLFALVGFQHVVANMFIFTLGIFMGANYSLFDIVVPLLAATLGNALSGGLFIPLVYYFLYVKSHRNDQHLS